LTDAKDEHAAGEVEREREQAASSERGQARQDEDDVCDRLQDIVYFGCSVSAHRAADVGILVHVINAKRLMATTATNTLVGAVDGGCFAR